MKSYNNSYINTSILQQMHKRGLFSTVFCMFINFMMAILFHLQIITNFYFTYSILSAVSHDVRSVTVSSQHSAFQYLYIGMVHHSKNDMSGNIVIMMKTLLVLLFTSYHPLWPSRKSQKNKRYMCIKTYLYILPQTSSRHSQNIQLPYQNFQTY